MALLALLLVGASCNSEKQDFNSGYFDIKQFMAAEADRLGGTAVTKTALLDGKTEQKTITLSKEQWAVELEAFREADIDKAAFVKKYRADTLRTMGITCIRYIATEAKLRTREMKVYYPVGQSSPSHIDATLISDNLFYSSNQILSYSPMEGYSIKGDQDIVLLGKDAFAIEARFVR